MLGGHRPTGQEISEHARESSEDAGISITCAMVVEVLDGKNRCNGGFRRILMVNQQQAA
jgi:hypothetical protein